MILSNLIGDFGRHEFQFQSTPAAGGIAPRNKLTDDFKKEVLKHLPAMRDLNLRAAADYMESWVRGELPLAPLLEVKGCLELHPIFTLFTTLEEVKPKENSPSLQLSYVVLAVCG